MFPDDDDDPRRRDRGDRNGPPGASALFEAARAAAEAFGRPPATRFRVRRGRTLAAMSRARKDGHRPDARLHVERFLLRSVLGVSARSLMASYRLSRSALYDSIAQGRRILQANALAAAGDDIEGLRASWRRLITPHDTDTDEPE